MCRICDEASLRGFTPEPHAHAQIDASDEVGAQPLNPARRGFFRTSAQVASVSAGVLLGACGGGSFDAIAAESPPPAGVGDTGRRTLLRGGMVLSMDATVGNFAVGDVLLEGSKIIAIGADLSASAASAVVINASGMIVMPGFIDTHHHQFELPCADIWLIVC